MVQHFEAEIIRTVALGDCDIGPGNQGGGLHTERRYAPAPRDIHEIANNSGCRRTRAGPRSFKDCAADEIAIGDNGVERSLDMIDRRVGRHHARMHPLLDHVAVDRGDAQQLDAEPEFLGKTNVQGRDAADTLDVHRLEIDFGAERQRGQDRQLVGGIDAVDIKARISLGETELLRFGEDVFEGAAGIAHLSENVVTGAIENAVDPLDSVRRQSLAEGLEDRDTTGNRGLAIKRHAGFFGQQSQFIAVVGDQCLVGGDDMLAGGERFLGQGLGDAVGTADQFDHDINVVGPGQIKRVVVPAISVERHASVTALGACRNAGDFDRHASAPGKDVGVVADHLDGRRADGAEARDPDPDPAHEPTAMTFVSALASTGCGLTPCRLRKPLMLRSA